MVLTLKLSEFIIASRKKPLPFFIKYEKIFIADNKEYKPAIMYKGTEVQKA